MFHPLVAIKVSIEEDELVGVSLVDGREGSCSIEHCGPEPLTLDDAVWIEHNLAHYVEQRSLMRSSREIIGEGRATKRRS